MNLVEHAHWYIENNFDSPLSLEEVADQCSVSRFHFARVFTAATGQPMMAFVRGRRLSEAAKALSRGAPDIIAVAISAGYNSHEAFTRAFRERFGMTPEALRAMGDVSVIPLVEPYKMDRTLLTDLEPPRFETGRPLRVAGLSQGFTFENNHGIPLLWQRFGPYIGHVPGETGDIAYGVCYAANRTDNCDFNYLAGVEITGGNDLPPELTRVDIPAQRYAVFTHRNHISQIQRTVNTIWTKWFAEADIEATDGPNFERYGSEFAPKTGNGGLEIWIPIKA